MDGWLFSLGLLLLSLLVYLVIHVACIKQRCRHARTVYETLCDYWACHHVNDSHAKKENLFAFLDGMLHRLHAHDPKGRHTAGFVKFVEHLKKKYFPQWSKDIEDYLDRLHR